MKKQLLLHLVMALLMSFPVAASGGGGGGGGAAGGGGGGPRAINKEKLALGRTVFYGRAKIAPRIVSKDVYQRQVRTLVRLQKEIKRSKSASRGKSFNPRELAGKMTTKQISALSYYVKITFDD